MYIYCGEMDGLLSFRTNGESSIDVKSYIKNGHITNYTACRFGQNFEIKLKNTTEYKFIIGEPYKLVIHLNDISVYFNKGKFVARWYRCPYKSTKYDLQLYFSESGYSSDEDSNYGYNRGYTTYNYGNNTKSKKQYEDSEYEIIYQYEERNKIKEKTEASEERICMYCYGEFDCKVCKNGNYTVDTKPILNT
jgi:hypothetical protein